MINRRKFLIASLATGALSFAPGIPVAGRVVTKKKMNLLILGGTNFVGPAIVEEALSKGHRVTLFNRGITRPHLFPDIERLKGFRRIDGDGDLSALAGNRTWDAVIDVWPEHASLVKETTTLLKKRSAFYYYISSIASYSDFSKPGLTETDRTRTDEPGWYGGEKAIAEQYVIEAFPNSHGIARNCAITGPLDPGSSAHYWLRRFASYERVLAPGNGKDPIQYVDVRDIASWVISSLENHRIGVYNLTGKMPPLTIRQFLEGMKEGIGSSARLEWVDADFLRTKHKVRSFSEMPYWAPLDEDEGFMQISSAKALQKGWKVRPLADTARDTWRFYQSHFFKDITFPYQGTGLSREREEELLAAWDAEHSTRG